MEDINTTPWIDLYTIDENSDRFINSIKLGSLDYSNFYNFYKMIDDKIYTFKNLEVVGDYKDEDSQSIEDTKEIIEKINVYNEKLRKIVAKIKKETQFNKKMKLNVEANNIKQEIERLQNIIKNV